MSKISVLSEDLINKIAAGEVIERPASVVKELIENSLDAGASQIVVEIEDSGKKLIRVTDNGIGMSREDAEKSILRYATSKINSVDDLFAIKTLGFRGEALASIAAISQLSITTKQEGAVEGFNLAAESGNVISSGIAAAEKGTIIEVFNLFFNTPVRKKFLRTDAVELRHIIDVIINYALANPKVYFKLLHEKHSLVNSPIINDARDNIASIYGINTAKDLLEINHNTNHVTVHGFIAKPYQAKNDKNQQVIIINGRWVRNNDISKAIYEAYHSTLFTGKHPIFVINLTINPEKIDVNVHPQKYEVKIEQTEEVCAAVFMAVTEALQKNNLIPVVDVDAEQQITFGTPNKKEIPPQKTKYQFEPSNQTMFAVNKKSISLDEDQEIYDEEAEEIGPIEDESVVSLSSSKLISLRFPPLRILGQVHKTYFVAETLDGFFYIDQHAAHERVLYERFMNQYLTKEVEMQRLLQGEVLEFSPEEKSLALEHYEILKEFGFQIEPFGKNTFVIKTVPLIFGRLQPKEIIFDVLGLLREGQHKLMETKEEIVTRMACRAAVMAGDMLTIPMMETILDDLARTKMPYTCPHGRPTMIKITVGELEKKFKRS